MKWYVVCLCFGQEKCEKETAEIAKRNNAISYVVEPVAAGNPSHHVRQIAFKGSIFL